MPGENQEGGTVIVPGRGRLSDQTDVANYRDMVTIIRDRVRAMVEKGHFARRGEARQTDAGLRRPLRRADATGRRQFVDAIYRDLRRSKR